MQLVSSGVIPPDGKLHPFSVAPVNFGAYGNCFVRVSAASFSRIDGDPTQTVRISVGSNAEGWQTIERLQLQNGSVTAFKVAPGSSKGGNIVNNSTVPVTVLVEHYLA